VKLAAPEPEPEPEPVIPDWLWPALGVGLPVLGLGGLSLVAIKALPPFALAGAGLLGMLLLPVSKLFLSDARPCATPGEPHDDDMGGYVQPPKTGGTSTSAYAALILMMLSGGGAALLLRRRREEEA